MALKQEYKEYRVLDLPSSGLKAGDRYYLNVGGGKYKTYIVSDGLQLTEEAGNEFIECDTVEELRALDARQIWALENGYYKGVTLNGYYTKGDTPAPIQYYLSDTTEEDDGGSVFEVVGIKLEHDFNGLINASYFGAKGDFINTEQPYFDNQEVINKILQSVKKGKIIFPKGAYAFSKTINIPQFDSNNSYAITFDSEEGRLEAGGTLLQPSGGTVRLCFVGEDDVVAVNSSATQTWVDFSNLSIRNSTNREDVDGVVVNDFKGNLLTNVFIAGFRDNLVIKGECYYTIWDKCTFSGAKRDNVHLDGLVNLATFRGCRFRNAEGLGVNCVRGGDGINFDNCFFEGNKIGAISALNSRMINIEKSYIEHNGSVEGQLSGLKAQIYISAYGHNYNVPTILNLKNNYILAGDKIDVVSMITSSPGANIGKVTINLVDNTIPANLINGTKDSAVEDRTHVVRSATPQINIRLINNRYSYSDINKMYFPCNYRPDQLNSFYADGDDSVLILRPEYDKAFVDNVSGSSVKTNKFHFYRSGTGFNGSNKDNSFNVDFDSPDSTTGNIFVRHGFNTNTTGNFVERYYSPDVDKELTQEFNYRTGKLQVKSIKLIGFGDILSGSLSPEHNVTAEQGTLYIRKDGVDSFIYRKHTGSGNTGWVKLIDENDSATDLVKGLVNQVVASEDVTTQASGATPTKIEFDTLLGELRDLKSKMRTAGILAT